MDGNRIWRVQTSGGPVLQKHFGERGGWLHRWAREAGTQLLGKKTSTLAAGRCATERRLLALWATAGQQVPRDLSEDHPDLAGPGTLVLEFVEGRPLTESLAEASLGDEARADLLRGFAAHWCQRHRLALERDEPGLVQEHGSLAHVLHDGQRFVTLDLENAFRPVQPVAPLIYKEIAGYLRSLSRCQDESGFRRDLALLVSAYPDRDRLTATARHYLDNPSLVWRMLWAVDRWRERRRGKRYGKYRVMEALRDTLAIG